VVHTLRYTLVVHTLWYTRRYTRHVHRWYGRYTGMYTRWYGRYTRLYHPGYTGIYTTRVYRDIHHPGIPFPTVHPWVHSRMLHAPRCVLGVGAVLAMRGERALGSDL